MILTLIATLFVSILICLSTTDAVIPTTTTIFILAGQSNMSGRGGVVNDTWDGFVPPEARSNSAIMKLGPKLNWELAFEPLHKDIDVNKTCGIGPGLIFANAVVVHRIGAVGLVPCARGGTSLREWQKGSKSGLYKALVRRGKAAVEAIEGGRIGGLLWYQGESDTLNETDANLYGQRLVKLFGDVRKDLELPLLPIFQVALASGPGPYKNRVRAAQLGINLINVFTVNANGLQLEPDKLHLTTLSQVHLGKMLADAYLKTMNLPKFAVVQRSDAYSHTRLSDSCFGFYMEVLVRQLLLMTLCWFIY
ncbi:unnamed protein product [Rhodiola kirilowii]